MRKLLLTLCLAAFGLQAQHIIAGDPCFTGGQVWPSPSMEWNPSFQCAVNLPAGDYQITFGMQEPTVAGPLQRLFSVLINGSTVLNNIDLYAMAKTGPVSMVQRLYLPSAGPVTFKFTATIRNAVISYIDIVPLPSMSGMVVITNGDHLVTQPCPIGYLGPAMENGTGCLVVFFSQGVTQ